MCDESRPNFFPATFGGPAREPGVRLARDRPRSSRGSACTIAVTALSTSSTCFCWLSRSASSFGGSGSGRTQRRPSASPGPIRPIIAGGRGAAGAPPVSTRLRTGGRGGAPPPRRASRASAAAVPGVGAGPAAASPARLLAAPGQPSAVSRGPSDGGASTTIWRGRLGISGSRPVDPPEQRTAPRAPPRPTPMAIHGTGPRRRSLPRSGGGRKLSSPAGLEHAGPAGSAASRSRSAPTVSAIRK